MNTFAPAGDINPIKPIFSELLESLLLFLIYFQLTLFLTSLGYFAQLTFIVSFPLLAAAPIYHLLCVSYWPVASALFPALFHVKHFV